MLRTRRPAFTLIELLVVVAIIALLISILLPSLSKARETSRMVKCLANQKQFITAANMYADANEQMYVPILHRWPGAGYWDRVEWMENIQFRGFLGVEARRTHGLYECRRPFGEGLMCPTIPEQWRNNRGRNYAFQWYLGPNVDSMEGYAYPSNVWGTIGPVIRRSKVVQPGMKFQFADSSDWHIPNPTKGNYLVKWDIFGEARAGAEGGDNGVLAYRHLGGEGASLHFFDGHGEFMTKYDVYDKDQAVARNRLWAIYE